MGVAYVSTDKMYIITVEVNAQLTCTARSKELC